MKDDSTTLPNGERVCSEPGCREKHYALGHCRRHYVQAQYWANPEKERARRMARYWANPEPERAKKRERYARQKAGVA